MDRYKQNAKWLTCFAPFRALSISAAYLTPFFLEHGLSLSQVFVLQSIFSAAALLWEIPSGYIADRFGRAFVIKVSAPIAAVAMIAYGFSGQFWQFVICELVLAVSYGLLSGVDTALLYDSLKAQGLHGKKLKKAYTKRQQRINAFGFGATAAGVPIAILLVQYVGLGVTLVADGALTLVGWLFARKLVEVPRSNGSQEAVRLSAWHAAKQLGGNIEARWLVTLGVALSTATYLGFWLSAPYYTSMGIPVVWFSAILAIRSLWKAGLSYRFTKDEYVERRMEFKMVSYSLMAGLVYSAMASQQIWLVFMVLGHDVVQALHGQPITARLNEHMAHEFRATMNSMVNLVQRLVFTIAGPLVGLLADKAGLGVACVAVGCGCSAVALTAVLRLRIFKTFH